ncbi:iron chelate uptake ABC transporter family permease subunit [Curtobacterium sp. MCJR17_020]|uniref:iron chelate uptake ABC transporter family permease subunit n=1 Tax=Curtobacterium sp. MCJR17_020 TaxID=2175619 RepID=UPI0015E87B2B|nr:iron chelate uptake ABC transporter family permease subunit [Curtobacterium sp. MCJR17_020]WIE74055.1 iron chelate uptake ABC transporter family permease subunit [Curtobacterium sp. MCJR17_020]
MVLLLTAPILSRPMRALELGDDTATSLGLNVARVRLTITAGGVLLVAVVVAAVGPIGFIALTAPRVAAWLTGSTSIPLLASTGAGAAATVTADLMDSISWHRFRSPSAWSRRPLAACTSSLPSAAAADPSTETQPDGRFSQRSRTHR